MGQGEDGWKVVSITVVAGAEYGVDVTEVRSGTGNLKNTGRMRVLFVFRCS